MKRSRHSLPAVHRIFPVVEFGARTPSWLFSERSEGNTNEQRRKFAASDEDTRHRTARHPLPDCAGGHAMGRASRARIRGFQRWWLGFVDRVDSADSG